jgi:hypothetical protein
LGDKSGAIAAFIDSLNRLGSQPVPMRAELQACLAGLYAQMGNGSEARKLYDKAEKEISVLRRQHPEDGLPSWLAETLYNMGRAATKPLTTEDFDGSLRSFERAQIWLLKVARFNDKKWSEPAAKEILRLYDDAWRMIESVPLMDDSDRVLALKDQQDKKINMGVSLYNLLSRLKLERGYDFSLENKYEKSIYEKLAPMEAQLEILLKSRPVEQSLTPAALEREGLKRKGKLVSPGQKRKR